MVLARGQITITEGKAKSIIALTSGQDLNSCTSEAVYVSSSTAICSSLLNKPAGFLAGECSLEVTLLGAANYYVQDLICKAASDVKYFRRAYSGSAFSAWVEVGKNGATGATGTGIESITEEYYLSTSKTTQTGGSWVTTPPAWVSGKYIWTRSKIVYKNPVSTVYTTPVVSSEWEAVNDIQVGGRNYIQNSKQLTSFQKHGNVVVANGIMSSINSGTNGNLDYLIQTIELIPNTQYTLSVIAWSDGSSKLRLWAEIPSYYIDFIVGTSKNIYSITFNSGSYSSIRFSINNASISADSFSLFATKPQLEKGNIVTDRTTAEEDVQAAIADAKLAGTNAQTSANTANTAVSTLNTYVDGAFKDGVVTQAEAQAIDKLNKEVNSKYNAAINDYNVVYANTYLEGTAKTDLLNAKITLASAKNALQTSINNAIADGKTTSAEKADVDSKYTAYDTAFLSYQTKLSNANKAIQTKLDSIAKGYADGVQVGGRNYILNSANLVVDKLNSAPGSSNEYSALNVGQSYMNITHGTQVAISFDLELTVNTANPVLRVYNSNKLGPKTFPDKYLSFTAAVGQTIKKRLSFVTTINDQANPQLSDNYIEFYSTYGSSNWYKITNLKLELGNKATDSGSAPEDVQAAIADAKLAGTNAQTSANTANTNVNALKNFTDTSFRDGIVNRAEKAGIEKYLNSVNESKLAIQSSYSQLYANTYLTGTAKTNLASAKTALDTAITNLISSINTAIADGITTTTEKSDVDSKYSLYNTALSTYQMRVEEANKAIQDVIKGYADSAQATANSAKNYIDNVLPTSLSSLQSQIDGVVDSWYYPYTPALNNYPASDWTTSTLKDRHIGDTFTNTQAFVDNTTTPNAGKSWRFVNNSGVYSWTPIADSDAVKALLAASKAQDTADGKRRVFTAQPTTPYDIGDLWMPGASGAAKKCDVARLTGAYVAADWSKADNSTDDTTAEQAKADAAAAQAAADALNYLKQAIGGSTDIKGGLVLANMMFLKNLAGNVVSGLSGIKGDNVFLFADETGGYAKALRGESQFLLKKDGTANLGIFKVDSHTIGVYPAILDANGKFSKLDLTREIMRFQDYNIPPLDSFLTPINQTVNYAGGSREITGAMEADGDFGNSGQIIVSTADNFNLKVEGYLDAYCTLGPSGELAACSAVVNLILYEYKNGSYYYTRTVDYASLSSKTVNTTFGLPKGTYAVRAEYSLVSGPDCAVGVSATNIVLTATGTSASACMIFGANGMVRIKDGHNYAYLTDTETAFSYGVGKYLKMSATATDFLTVKGPTNMPGVLAGGECDQYGAVIRCWGHFVCSVLKNATGQYKITHNINHMNYTLNPIPRSTAGWYKVHAVILDKTPTYVVVGIVDSGTATGFKDFGFDFTINGLN